MVDTRKLFLLNGSYTYATIEAYASQEEFMMDSYGRQYVGEEFLVLKSDDDKTISFVLDGTRGMGYIYRCIYTDL